MVILLDNGHGCEYVPPICEEWRDIPGWEGLYLVSSLGNIKALEKSYIICNTATVTVPEKILKPHYDRGYLNIELNHNGFSKSYPVHRLVAMAFIPNPEGKPNIDHIDCVRDNNKVSNLRWVTQKENLANPITRAKMASVERITGPNHPLFEENSPDSKPLTQYDLLGHPIAHYSCCHQASRRNKGYNYSCIARVCRGERMTYKGYIWKYDNTVR